MRGVSAEKQGGRGGENIEERKENHKTKEEITWQEKPWRGGVCVCVCVCVRVQP